MNKILFKEGDTFEINGETRVIKVAKKDFSTQIVKYRMDNGELVNQDFLIGLNASKKATPPPTPETPKQPAAPKVDQELVDLQKQYVEVFKKNYPATYKNNKTWLKEKINAFLEAQTVQAKYEALSKLDEAGMAKFIKEKNLDIDPVDYEDLADLLKAVCEELEIEIPE